MKNLSALFASVLFVLIAGGAQAQTPPSGKAPGSEVAAAPAPASVVAGPVVVITEGSLAPVSGAASVAPVTPAADAGVAPVAPSAASVAPSVAPSAVPSAAASAVPSAAATTVTVDVPGFGTLTLVFTGILGVLVGFVLAWWKNRKPAAV